MTTILAAMLFAGCGSETKNAVDTGVAEELTILAAASLTDVCNEIKTEYEAAHPNVTLHFSYGASGALQTQIEEGAPADLFFSAATKQMTALNDEGLMDPDSIVKLLENKVVLIVPEDSDKDITSFEDVATDKVGMIGLGEPGSVPVGQYSEEIFSSLGILDTVKTKANYGSDVRTVLSWVETGAVDCGVVYATDAYVGENIQIVCEAPAGSCKQVIYPVGIVKASEHADAAAEFLAYCRPIMPCRNSKATDSLRQNRSRNGFFTLMDISEGRGMCDGIYVFFRSAFRQAGPLLKSGQGTD